MKIAAGILVAATSLMAGIAPPATPKFARAYALKPAEGVFAYSRISPDGRYLAYASETDADRRKRISQTVVIVDLATKKEVFREPGMDAYFSGDGNRVIYLSFAKGMGAHSHVTIRDQKTGKLTRDARLSGLGDYYSWATRDGREVILTITGNYFYLDGNKAILPHSSVPPCARIGKADRPLISHDGKRISTFVNGTVVIRNLTDCAYSFDTGIQGSKTDFSWDGRYVAMHAPKPGGRDAYDIVVVDMQARTVRNITSTLKGSSYFPSWTRDGRLSFRYDGDDFHGFLFASDMLKAKALPLSEKRARLPETRTWAQIFPETAKPSHAYNLVLVYGTWSAHSPVALTDMQKTSDYIARAGLDVGVMTATDQGSLEADVTRMLETHHIDLPRILLATPRAPLTEVVNQSPSTLLFRDGVLIDRKLGAQSDAELRAWLTTSGVKPRLN